MIKELTKFFHKVFWLIKTCDQYHFWMHPFYSQEAKLYMIDLDLGLTLYKTIYED